MFRPNDTHDLHQIPPANVQMPGVERIKGYRYPSPGSQKVAEIPQLEDEDRMYDIKYYSRNTRREGHLGLDGQSTRLEDQWATESNEVALIDADAPLGSPGNHYTAATVKAYDPTGLRSAMTATHAEMYKSIQSHMPNHNVSYAWEDQIEELVVSYESKGLPPVPGMNSPKCIAKPVVISVEQSAW